MGEGVKFGTSGLRGLVAELTAELCAGYTSAFVLHMHESGAFAGEESLLIGRDLRGSSPAIAGYCASAVRAAGIGAIDCGALPTPALALEAMRRRVPAIMVTGSHIPADRNGLKFYRPDGEIDKADEAAILAGLGHALPAAAQGDSDSGDALNRYRARYLELKDVVSLAGLRVGVYQHSSVARDLLVDVLGALGAEPVPLGRADGFVPVDTEALRAEDVELARCWAPSERLDAIVSTDGDADRPLIADEAGTFLRGDVVGILTAEFLGAGTVVTPVTSTSAVEQSGLFQTVVRTRVGSPHVIAGMAGQGGLVLGFEANGGVLLGTEADVGGTALAPLPTRDALLPIISVLALARRDGLTVAQLLDRLPSRRTASAVLRDTPAAVSAPFLDRLAADAGYANQVLAPAGEITGLSNIDGVKLRLSSGDTVHLRPSGNAPELRCYTEAATQERADELLALGLAIARAELSASA